MMHKGEQICTGESACEGIALRSWDIGLVLVLQRWGCRLVSILQDGDVGLAAVFPKSEPEP